MHKQSYIGCIWINIKKKKMVLSMQKLEVETEAASNLLLNKSLNMIIFFGEY